MNVTADRSSIVAAVTLANVNADESGSAMGTGTGMAPPEPGAWC
ncbi:hypothetical protein PC129_g2797 [Phytophthora cactorum]|uniref:Uncharacterized protein n=1 Tax=Phytophthora cactorum TaxID=29920 RepID=A0A329SJ29_9STRA|nr:hypothetical protein Pcac1_g20733 [Phytophthora cactorum]KAG2834598.1 hypothetical protein PC112_g6021 [Phytophthora cactorum]KAG2837017.1 hypothetical protein PC111_g4810 [Phytophthora cactorum]KAG2862839.1 hypothetical protein PC113_g5959 [Phytophthora cactorum]KAG2919882.1 hypothetical protein PC114_g6294 [Phytophthora cactorum]